MIASEGEVAMKKEEINGIFQDIFSQPYLSAEQIPKLSLYIDQILTLFAEGSIEEQALTKAMVNNYSKEKMLQPIKGKKYSREQILQILMICRLKPVLSMEQIKAWNCALMEDTGGEEMLERILNRSDEQRTFSEATAEFFWTQNQENQTTDLSTEDCATLVLELRQLSDLFAQAAKKLSQKTFEEESQRKK